MKLSLNTEHLISCRKRLGMTQQQAAELIGVSQPAYQRYESGTRAPSIQVIRQIADVFHTSADYLTGESEAMEPDTISVDRKTAPVLYSLVERCRQCDDEMLKRLMAYMDALQPLAEK